MDPTPPRKGHALVVGAGAFGISAALELQSRGWTVHVVALGPLPHPDGASNDISKIVRTDYGTDTFYADLGERAIQGWLKWNQEWGWRAFHQRGFLVLAPGPMQPGQFEHDSYTTAIERGQRVERLTDPGVRAKHPMWSPDLYPDGYVNLEGGWSPSGKVVDHLCNQFVRNDGLLTLAEAVGLDSGASGPTVHLKDGTSLSGDRVVVACGSWSSLLVPELEPLLRPTGHPVFHYHVDDPRPFQTPHAGPWAAGTAATGWYGFPALDDGTVKVANHGPGRVLDPLQPRVVEAHWEDRFRAFVEQSIPGLRGAPIVKRRLCAYCDTFDSDFLIDPVPGRPGVVVATGGSGHGYKFTPVLGGIIADAVEGIPNPTSRRFGWRAPKERRIDPARFPGGTSL